MVLDLIHDEYVVEARSLFITYGSLFGIYEAVCIIRLRFTHRQLRLGRLLLSTVAIDRCCMH